MKCPKQEIQTAMLSCRLVKHSILQKILATSRVCVQNVCLNAGKIYIEDIMQHNLPEQILDKLNASSGKSGDDPAEQWNKQGSSAQPSKSKSKYLNPPNILSKPKNKMKAVTVKQDQRQRCTGVYLYMWCYVKMNYYRTILIILSDTIVINSLKNKSHYIFLPTPIQTQLEHFFFKILICS